jgi:uncharacterized protein (UPF0218 family)
VEVLALLVVRMVQVHTVVDLGQDSMGVNLIIMDLDKEMEVAEVLQSPRVKDINNKYY